VGADARLVAFTQYLRVDRAAARPCFTAVGLIGLSVQPRDGCPRPAVDLAGAPRHGGGHPGVRAAGLALAASMHISVLDPYLSTTPGGINAVLATAAETRSGLALVSGVQSVRLFVVVLLALRLVRWATRPYAPEEDRSPVSTA
jgi:hypothetical protein